MNRPRALSALFVANLFVANLFVANLFAFLLVATALALASRASAQTLYKSVGPDGKVTYSDKAPPASAGTVKEIQRQAETPPPTAKAAANSTPGISSPLPPNLPASVRAALEASAEMRASRECARSNESRQAQLRAAANVSKTQQSIQAAGAKAPAYLTQMLEQQYKLYKSLGGTAASPQDVTVPEDPCKSSVEALRVKAAALEAGHRQCQGTRGREVKLALLAQEVVNTRAALAMLATLPADKAGVVTAPVGKTSAAQLRAEMAQKFQDYKNAGGTASRAEDVAEMPDPCRT